jgi:sterol 24-C-methyltransferase
MGLKAGMRVLDVGCGVGGPAREIARFADVTIVGLNNNEFQVNRARRYTAKAGLSDQVTFVKGDFMKLSEQFGENYFDAVYAIEATVHAPSFEGVYGEIMKVLKPGGIVRYPPFAEIFFLCLLLIRSFQFGCYEWVMTPQWDATDPMHKQIAHEIEISSGIPEMRILSRSRDAFDNVGFQVLHEEDLAERPDPIPWYYPLEGDIFKAQTLYDLFMCWRISWSGRLISHSAIWLMEKVGIMPKGTVEVTEQLKHALKGIVDGGKTKVWIVYYHVVNSC